MTKSFFFMSLFSFSFFFWQNTEIHHHLGAIRTHGNRFCLLWTTFTKCVWFCSWRKFTHKDSAGAAKCCQLACFQWENLCTRDTQTQAANNKHFPPLFYHLEAGQWPFKSPSWEKGLKFLKQPPLAKSVLMRLWLLAGIKGTQLSVCLYVLVCMCEYEGLNAQVFLSAHINLFAMTELTQI